MSESVYWRVNYGNAWNCSGQVIKPGATSIRLRFSKISTEQGHDWLRTSSGNNWSGSYSKVTCLDGAHNAMGLSLRSARLPTKEQASWRTWAKRCAIFRCWPPRWSESSLRARMR